MSTSIGFWLTDVQPKSRRTTPSEAYRRTTIVASRRTKRARENTSVGALVSRALGGRDMEGVSGGFRKRRGAIATALIRAYPCTDVLCASGRPTRLPRRGSTLDRPQRPRAGARDAALLPSAAHGLCRGGHLRRFGADGRPMGMAARTSMDTTVQTLGRVAIIGGSVLVSLANVYLLRGAGALPEAERTLAYLRVYELALVIPFVSVLGVVFGMALAWRAARRLGARGFARSDVRRMLNPHGERPPVSWWILGGGLAFAVVSLGVGVGQVAGGQEIVFGVSMAIVLFLIRRLTGELEADARHVLVGTALVVFVFRAMPGPGAGSTWWMIDQLGFDQQFLATLSLIGSVLTLAGLFIFRRFMAERSIAYIVGFLTIVSTVLGLPVVGMYYGLHEWTAAHTGGLVDARMIVLIDTALESPLGQIAMVPMLAWIANSAPDRLKATFFAVLASFTNLALAAAQLGTKYLNQAFIVTREVRDASGTITTPADYSQLGTVLVLTTVIAFVVPMLAVVFVKTTRFRSA